MAESDGENLPCNDCDNCPRCDAADKHSKRLIEKEEEEIENEFSSAARMAAQAMADDDGRFKWGGRMPGARSSPRLANTRFAEYLADTPINPPRQFQEVFHISLKLYWAVQNGLLDEEPLFAQRCDGFGREDFC